MFLLHQMTNANDTNDATEELSNAITIADAQSANNTCSRQNQRRRVFKRKRRMAKMITVETRVLGKYNDLV